MGLGQRREQRVIESLVPEAPIETFDEGILHRLAWRDVMPFDAGLLAPPRDCHRGQLRAVVGDDRGGPAAPAHDGVQFAHDAQARQVKCRRPAPDTRACSRRPQRAPGNDGCR